MKAGTYIVNVRLLGVDIASSPYVVVVNPGEVSAVNSFTSINSQDIKLFEAGNTYLFELQLVDIYGNQLTNGTSSNGI